MTTKPKIIILIIAIVIVGGFLIYKFPLVETEKRKNLETKEQEQEVVLPEEESQPSEDITIIEQPDGSRVVRNEKEGFEIAIPKKWKEVKDMDYREINESRQKILSIEGDEGELAEIRFHELERLDVELEFWVKEWLRTPGRFVNPQIIGEEKIRNYNVIKVKDDDPVIGTFFFYFFKVNSKICEIYSESEETIQNMILISEF